MGFQRAGFRIAFATDNDPCCAQSHRRNFRRSKTAFFEGPIQKLNDDEIADLLRKSRTDHCDVLIGGPPCPPFSKSRFYRKEKPRGLSDPVGSDTFRGYLKVLRTLAPSAFLLENVAGLAYGVHREALDTVLREAAALGYSCSYEVLNAANYGVPQIRERCFVVGVTSGRRFDFPPPTHTQQPGGDLFSLDLPPWRTAGQAIADLDTEENASHDRHFAGGKHHDLLCEIPPGENYLYFTKERGYPKPKFRWRSRYWSFLLKLSPNLPSWTIQARRSNNMGPFHWRNRILRIAEVKRLQAFPDDWYLAGTTEQQWRQVGNAVPVLLAEQLACAIKAHIGPRKRRK